MSTSAPPPAPPVPPPGRLPFKTIFKRTAIVIANLTSIVVLVRELPPFLKAMPRVGWGEPAMWFIARVTVQAALLAIINTLLVALPLAGAIYYFRFLAERGH